MINKLLLLILCCLPVLAQQKFVPDAIGRVIDPAFQKLIKERGYTLVGIYDTVSRNPVLLYARVLKNDKWGFIDVQGREVIAPQFTHIEDFSYGRAKVKDTNGNYYLVNLKGKTVSTGYESIREFNGGFAIVTSGDKEGVINPDGQQVLPLEFNEIRVYRKGILAICNEKFSLYNYKGRPLTPKPYDRLLWYGRFLKAYKGNTYCLLNSETGKPINNEWYAGESGFLSSLAAAKIDDAYIDHTVLLVNNGTYSFLIDEKGRQLGDKYEKIEEVYGPYYLGYSGNDQWLLDETGKRIAKIKGYIESVYDGGNVFITDDDGRNYYFNGKIEELDFSAYDEVKGFAYGLVAVRKAGKYGFADYKGRLVIDAVYDETQYISEAKGICAVKLNGKWGLIDSRGGVVQPFVYDHLSNNGAYYDVFKDNKWGVVTYKGEEKLALVYDDINDLPKLRYKNEEPGWLMVQQNGKWGVVNKQFGLVVAPVYDELMTLNYGHTQALAWMDEKLLYVRKGSGKYLVTWKGEDVMPLDGDISDVNCQYKGLIVYTRQDGKLYRTDLYGNQRPFNALVCE